MGDRKMSSGPSTYNARLKAATERGESPPVPRNRQERRAARKLLLTRKQRKDVDNA